VVNLITTIAEQTNLLALNATIEAAARAIPDGALRLLRRR
jgi:Methyl-accepting chemotaxis protein (MCP) signaling domain.